MWIAALLTLLLGVMIPEQSWAGGFSVDPVHLELNASQNATALTVANYNTEPLVMQVRVYRWERRGHEDVLSEVDPGEAALVTPPLFRLAPGGGSQVIRIGFQRPATPLTDERQWRVIVEEVPKPVAMRTAPAEGDASPEAGDALSVAVHVRVSLPLLQRPPRVHKDLQWSLERAGENQLRLIASNLGNVTERLDDIRLAAPSDAARVAGPYYVFPGESRAFALHPDAPIAAGTVRLSVQGTPRPLLRDLVLSAQ